MIQTQVCLRPASPHDTEAVRAFLAGLPAAAQYQRFFTGLGSVSPSMVRELVRVHERQWVTLALFGTEVVGHAMASVNAGGAAELGVVIADGHRRRGLATRMLRGLLDQVVRSGADRLRLDMLCENRVVIDWVRRALPEAAFERDGQTLTGYAPLPDATVAAAIPAA